MRDAMDRRAFVSAAVGLGAAGVARGRALAQPGEATAGDARGWRGEQDPALVREIVAKAHFDLAGVKALLGRQPELAKASWDWGFGDWESALGAASHTGRREIAEALMAHGARPTLFTHAMLGHVDVVRAIVEAQPGVQGALGPHGITLMRHAELGGERARAVVEYLGSIGGADVGQPNQPLFGNVRAQHVGVFTVAGTGERVEILDRRGDLMIKVGEGTARGLLHAGGGVHHPAGAPSVDVQFKNRGREIIAVEIEMGGRMWRADRAPG